MSQPITSFDAPRGLRVGQGYDIHRLVPGRKLILAGVELPWDLGLEGHSDGDAICHALADAVLGAAGLGDIGTHFPSEEMKWKDASSIGLLAGLGKLVAGAGLQVLNADVTVILEVPRIGPYREAMVANLAAALNLPASQVGLKAKSNDGLGPVGQGEAIAALAVVLVGAVPDSLPPG
ncbi:MAG TPA: 2-C-methyl-D-erythritol 2,4-cyclodiphosphate synthase [Candidatus Dormibacteraeota bacterium]|nr:2-C-methyl-D-erythritol 2,4-cyclodiphosphate synthase [Candidatus Dormibacteraeota bacterium]